MIYTVQPQLGAGTGPLRPSRYWYLVSACLLVAAAACLMIAVTGMLSWDRQIQDFQRVPVPGRGAVTLAQPGDYVLYVETRGGCCAWSVGSQKGPLADWSLRLAIGAANGQRVPVTTWSGVPVSYSVSGHQGVTGMSFSITRPGTYLVQATDVHPAAVTDLAVGRNVLRATLLPLILLLAGLAALLGAAVSLVFTMVRRGRARRRTGAPPGGMGTGSGALAASAPVLVMFAGPGRQARGTVLIRTILTVPVLIGLYFVRFAAWLVLVTAWFGALFTGRLPDYAAEFLAWFQRWEVRTSAYLLLLTDRYPTAEYQDDYPVAVTVRPGRLNRAAVFFRLVLVIPAWCVATLLVYGLGPLLMVPTWLIVLIRGRMPRPLYEAIAASVRYWARVKAYWYLLTDVYPAGLFGEEPAPALNAAWPAFGAAGAAPVGHDPLPGLAADQPVPMPADYVTPPAAAPAAPEPLVLSRQGKGLVGLILASGIVTPLALFALFFVPIAQAPPGGSAPGSAAAGPPASTAPPPTASPAPALSTTQPARPGRTAQWLNGLSSLSTDMNAAMGASNQILTSGSLRSTARQLGHCPAKLTALGPATAQLRQVDRLAVRACQDFEQGARYFAAAARFLRPDGSATDQHKLNKLLDRGNASVNKGSYLISTAVADGSLTGSPG